MSFRFKILCEICLSLARNSIKQVNEPVPLFVHLVHLFVRGKFICLGSSCITNTGTTAFDFNQLFATELLSISWLLTLVIILIFV